MTEVLVAKLEESIEARLAKLEKLASQKKRVDALMEELEHPFRKGRGTSAIALSILLVAPLTTAVHGCVQLQLAEQAQAHKLQLESDAQNHRLSQEVWAAFGRAADGDRASDQSISVRHRRQLLHFLERTASSVDIRKWASEELKSDDLNLRLLFEKMAEKDRLENKVKEDVARNGKCEGECEKARQKVERLKVSVSKNVDDPLDGL